MVVDPQTGRFWQAALQSGAIDAAGLKACWEEIPEAKRSADAIDRRLARQAVNTRRLSLWQAQQIIAGRGFALKIDKYVLIDLIGQGGMGRVYLARDTRLNRKVALKILSRERMSNPRALARFEREGKVGAQLQHDNLVRIYDEGDAHGLRFLVMEFIDGRNAAQLLADLGRFPFAAAALVGKQIALGLEHARQKGLIHRDVNPQNIVITRDGIAKLTDLGLAIDQNDPDDIVTRDGATVGTFDYISPEQARHPRDVDTRSDIYSLGCSLYHLLSGRIPFPAASLPEKLYAHQLTPPDPLGPMIRDLPAALDDVIRSMMAKAPDDRPSTPLEVVQLLDPFVGPKTTLAGLIDEAARRAAGETEPEEPVTPARPAVVTASGANGVAGPGDRTATDSVRMIGTDPDLPLGDMAPEAAPTQSATPPSQPAPGSLPGGFVLPIDLGPDPSLTESLVGNRMRSRSRSSVSGERLAARPSNEPRGDQTEGLARWKRLIAVAALIAVVGAVVATGLYLGGAFGPGKSAKPTEGGPATAGGGGPVEATPDLNDGGELATAGTSGFFVRMTGATDLIPQPSLQEALNRASGGRGEVLVGDAAGEIVVESLATLVPAGEMVLKPLPGKTPTLTIRLKGRQPWIQQSNGHLKVQDLTFLVHASAPAGAEAPPLIDSNDRVTIERCTFVELSSQGKETCAIRHRGQEATLVDDFFLGFDHPLILDAYQGSRAVIRNCLMAWPEGQAGVTPGWAVRLTPRPRAQPGGAELTIEGSTFLRAAGLIETVGLDPSQPVRVKVSRSALRADHLMTWAPPETGTKMLAGIVWSGSDNRYDLQKPAWIVEDHDGLKSPEGAPSDLDSWRALAGEQEAESSTQALVRLRDEGALRSGSADPARYKLAEDAGADLSKVGPPGPAKP